MKKVFFIGVVMFFIVLYVEMFIIECIFFFLLLDGNVFCVLKVLFDGECVIFLKGKVLDYECFDLWEYYIDSGEICMLFNFNDL